MFRMSWSDFDQSTDVTSIQNTIVYRLPVVTFIEGDGLVLVVIWGLSVGVVRDDFVMFWVEQLLVAVVGDGAVLGHSEGFSKQYSKHQLPVCTVHQKT